MMFQRVCVFCGSSAGRDPRFLEVARELGVCLAGRGMALVYGGAHVGLMGAIADTMLARGAEVIGVIPRGLVDREVAHERLTELRVVNTMHERKALMADLAGAFVALPGGFGTLDEFFEILTWAQLGIHRKPCGMLNVEGFFDPLLVYLDHAVAAGFLKQAHRDLFLVDTDAGRLLERMAGFESPVVGKWMDAGGR